MNQTKEPRGRTITENQISDFRSHLRLEERSEATIEKYVRDVRGLMIYLQGMEITKELLLNYKQHLIDRKYAARSINSMIASVNSFFTCMEWYDMRIKQMRLQRQIYCPEEKELTRDEYERMIRTADKKKNERLKLMIETLCGTGIRVSELKFITVGSLKSGEAQVTCKGKTRTVFIVRKLKQMLTAYCKNHGITEGVIFRTRNGRPVNRITVWREMKSLCRESSVNPAKVFPHNLRHLFARTFNKIENDISKLADVLGHSNINTTRIYIISTGREHRRKMEQMRLII